MTRRAAGLLLAAACTATSAAFNPFERPPVLREQAQLLDVDEAFRVLPPQRDGDRLRIEWDIAPGYYLYRQRLAVSAVEPAQAMIGVLKLPEGISHHDEHFGDVQIYRGDLAGTVDGTARVKRVRIHYQGCADAGVCYPPQEKEFDLAAGPEP